MDFQGRGGHASDVYSGRERRGRQERFVECDNEQHHKANREALKLLSCRYSRYNDISGVSWQLAVILSLGQDRSDGEVTAR